MFSKRGRIVGPFVLRAGAPPVRLNFVVAHHVLLIRGVGAQAVDDLRGTATSFPAARRAAAAARLSVMTAALHVQRHGHPPCSAAPERLERHATLLEVLRPQFDPRARGAPGRDVAQQML